MRLGTHALGLAVAGAASLLWACATTAATQDGPVPSDSPGYSDPAPAAPAAIAGDADARALFEKTCSECHEYQYATQLRNSREGWTQVVGLMASHGMAATDEQKKTIIDYLTANHGPRP